MPEDRSGRFVMMSGARLLRSGLTGTVYVVTRWKQHLNGTIEAVKKFDVTEDFNALVEATDDARQ